jgi:hypothetical protein
VLRRRKSVLDLVRGEFRELQSIPTSRWSDGPEGELNELKA